MVWASALRAAAEPAASFTLQTKARGASVMQPPSHAGGEAAGGAAPAAAEPGSSAFAALAAADVRPDAVFFHKFYSAKEVRRAFACPPVRMRCSQQPACKWHDVRLPTSRMDDQTEGPGTNCATPLAAAAASQGEEAAGG